MLWHGPIAIDFVATAQSVSLTIPERCNAIHVSDANCRQLLSMSANRPCEMIIFNSIFCQIRTWNRNFTWNWDPILGTYDPKGLALIVSTPNWKYGQRKEIRIYARYSARLLRSHMNEMNGKWNTFYCLISFSLSSKHRISRKSSKNSRSISVS